MKVAPCVYPSCSGDEGQPVLTSLTVCDDCRHRLRRLLDDVALDYARLKRYMPKPAPSGTGGGGGGQKSFGHPAEWASSTAQDIARNLNEIHDDLADVLGATPAPHPGTDEAGQVARAHRFLVANFPALCTASVLDWAAVVWSESHTGVMRSLGMTRMVKRLAAPCPTCGVCAMVLIPAPRPRRGQPPQDAFIQCRECGADFDAAAYDGYTREVVQIVKAEHEILIDAAIYIYDTPKRDMAAAMAALWFQRAGLA